jgi:hypothetical protein
MTQDYAIAGGSAPTLRLPFTSRFVQKRLRAHRDAYKPDLSSKP